MHIMTAKAKVRLAAPTHDEREWVEQLIANDRQATDLFADRYLRRFAWLARRAGIPAQDAEDVAHEIFLAALSQLQRGLFRGHCRLSVWLTAIVRGKVADYWRAQKQNISPPTEVGAEDCLAPLPQLNHSSAVELVDFTVVLSVRQALNRMQVLLRLILLLKYEESYTIAEISQLLGLSNKQVVTRLYQAEDLLRATMQR